MDRFCHIVSMQDAGQTNSDQDPRRQAILKAAFDAFCSYGFRRTSMEDIARGANMSRAALYLHYRNKEDIFRSLAQFYYDDAVAQVRACWRVACPCQDAGTGFRGAGGPDIRGAAVLAAWG
jgi:AcrR family transcriptional regulator